MTVKLLDTISGNSEKELPGHNNDSERKGIRSAGIGCITFFV